MMSLTTVLLFAVSGALYSETYEKFAPCFIDVKGWSADEVTGVDLFMPNMSLVNAMRTYSAGEKEASVMVITGNKALTSQYQEAGSIETTEFNAVMKEIGGFQVTSVYDKKNKTGSVVVILKQTEQKGSFLTITYKSLSEAEAIEFSRVFDWKRIMDIAETIDF